MATWYWCKDDGVGTVSTTFVLHLDNLWSGRFWQAAWFSFQTKLPAVGQILVNAFPVYTKGACKMQMVNLGFCIPR